jgi:hypothetical protein
MRRILSILFFFLVTFGPVVFAQPLCEKGKMNTNWPFSDPQNVAVFTTEEILSGSSPILHVVHDIDDGAWQFHSGGLTDLSKAKVVSLRKIVQLDPTICDLADLPLGWVATRQEKNAAWIRTKKDG